MNRKSVLAWDLFESGYAALENGDIEKSICFFERSVRFGCNEAMDMLATILDDDILVPRNRKRAIYLYRKAASKGYSVSAYNLAILYRKELNRRMFFFWRNRAISLGDSDAIKLKFEE